MYFYSHKINNHEQNILLEMCHVACLGFRDGTCTYGVILFT